MTTRTWKGRAIAIAQVDTITVADTWATNDTCTLTINGKDLVLTVGTDTATAEVATAIAQMVNGDPQTGTGDHTYSQTGDNVGEFSQITAVADGSVVTLTADNPGVPFTLSVTEDTAGDGVATEATATAATGPNFWSNADNWSGDAVPVDGDDIVYDEGNTNCLYDIDTGIQPASFTQTAGYSGTIGLPKVNEDNSALPYDEYRSDYLTFTNHAGTAACAVTLGDGDGEGSGRVKLDLGNTATPTLNIYGSGQRVDSGIPAVLLKATEANTVLNLQRGDVGYAFYEGEAGHLSEVNVGWIDNQLSDSQLVCGSGTDLADAAIVMSGGQVEINSATGSGTIVQTGGELSIRDGAHAAIDCYVGTLFYRSSGTLGSLDSGDNATLDFSKDNRSRTVSACEVHGPVTILDPAKTVTWSAGVDFNHTNPLQSTLNFGHNVKLTPGAVS